MRFKDRIRPQWVKTGRKLLSARIKLGRLRKEFNLPPISGDPLGKVKASDTLFVLGSGASINTLSPKDWEEIGRHDTVGLNFWLLHDFVPDTYVFEPPKDLLDREALINNLSLRAEDYCQTQLFMKDGERFDENELRGFLSDICKAVGERVVLSLDWELRTEDPGQFQRQLVRLDRSGWLGSPRMPLPRKRASIFTIALMALRANYKRIVLCGVDLNNAAYFYDELRSHLISKGLQVPLLQEGGGPHLTDNEQFGALTVSRALEILNENVLVPRGVELLVALRSSKLHPYLNAYFDRP
jgi:hypothetical protein